MLKAAILGFGGVGQGMMRLMKEHRVAEVIGACDRDEAKLELARAMGLKATTDCREACGWDVDFVCITSTNYAHREHALAAVDAGKHFLIEKPPALSLAELDEMIEAAEDAGLVTVVNYVRRFDPCYLRMKEMIDTGVIGEVMSMTSFSSRGWGLAMHGNPHPAVAHPEESGNWLLHHACHIIDLTTWYLGPARTAYCRGNSTLKGKDSPEVVWGLMEMESGATGVIGDSVSALYQKSVSIVGTKATMELLRTPQGNVLHMRRENGKEFPYFEDILGYGTFWHHTSTLRHLAECIHRNEGSPHDLAATRASLAACLALEESRKSGRVVPLDEVDRKR